MSWITDRVQLTIRTHTTVQFITAPAISPFSFLLSPFPKMLSLIPLLHTGKFSCVIRKGMEVRTFTQRGVTDLYELLTTTPDFLQGSSVADKVIGKGAAALMIRGGVKKVYADVISQPALTLFQAFDIDVSYDTLTDNIINRAGTGICPVEERCLPLEKLEEMVEAIGNFVAGIQGNLTGLTGCNRP